MTYPAITGTARLSLIIILEEILSGTSSNTVITSAVTKTISSGILPPHAERSPGINGSTATERIIQVKKQASDPSNDFLPILIRPRPVSYTHLRAHETRH